MRHLFLALSLFSLGAAVIAFINNLAFRTEINDALKLSQKDTPHDKKVEAPEHLGFKSYDGNYLKQVAALLDAVKAKSATHGTLLDLYRRPVLLWNDVVFAIAIALFSASLWAWVLVQFDLTGICRYLVIVLAASALLYGISDTAEDIALERLLGKPEAISPNDAQMASRFTKLKIVTIIGSVTGGLVFAILNKVVPDNPSRIWPAPK